MTTALQFHSVEEKLGFFPRKLKRDILYFVK